MVELRELLQKMGWDEALIEKFTETDLRVDFAEFTEDQRLVVETTLDTGEEFTMTTSGQTSTSLIMRR
jgi:hypothetical protein